MKSILYDFTPSELQELLDTSNSYSDLLRTIGLNPKGGNPETLKRIIQEYQLDETKLNENRKKLFSKNSVFPKIKNKKPMEDILSNKYEFHSSSHLLKRLVNEGYKEYRCEECGINSWMGKDITLQLEHIDGNHSNNNLNNLKILCPNCHSQTSTFAGRNVDHSDAKRRKRVGKAKHKLLKPKILKTMPPISREDLKQKIRTIPFVEIGKQFGVTDNAIRKWCDKYKLPRKVSEIHNITDEEWEKI